MQTTPALRISTFVWRVTALHILTYFVVGLLAFTLLDYRSLYAQTELRHLMRPTSSAWVAAGPVLQVIRGVVFGLVLWPVRDIIVEAKRGTLVLWALLVGLAVFGAAGPAPGSLEGFLFTTVPWTVQLLGLPEVLVQTLLMAWLLGVWHRNPSRRWNVGAGLGLGGVVLMSTLGVAQAFGMLPEK